MRQPRREQDEVPGVRVDDNSGIKWRQRAARVGKDQRPCTSGGGDVVDTRKEIVGMGVRKVGEAVTMHGGPQLQLVVGNGVVAFMSFGWG